MTPMSLWDKIVKYIELPKDPEGGVMTIYHRIYYRAYNEYSGRWETLEACPYCTSLKEDIIRMRSCLTSISEDGDDKGADMASRAERCLEWLDKKAALAEVRP